MLALISDLSLRDAVAFSSRINKNAASREVVDLAFDFSEPGLSPASLERALRPRTSARQRIEAFFAPRALQGALKESFNIASQLNLTRYLSLLSTLPAGDLKTQCERNLTERMKVVILNGQTELVPVAYQTCCAKLSEESRDQLTQAMQQYFRSQLLSLMGRLNLNTRGSTKEKLLDALSGKISATENPLSIPTAIYQLERILSNKKVSIRRWGWCCFAYSSDFHRHRSDLDTLRKNWEAAFPNEKLIDQKTIIQSKALSTAAPGVFTFKECLARFSGQSTAAPLENSSVSVA